MKRTYLLLLLGCALSVSQAAGAAMYTASMSGANEGTPNNSTATGFTSVEITGNSMSVHVDWDGLIGGNPSAAHIHCCINPGSPNIGVAVGFPSFPATTSGTYDHVFDLLDIAIYTSAFVTNFGGGTAAGSRDALIAGLDTGTRAYSNIHNAMFPGGEIRGNLAPIPLPGALLLLLSALGGLGLSVRPRKGAD